MANDTRETVRAAVADIMNSAMAGRRPKMTDERRKACLEAADNALEFLTALGLAVVPVEPSEAMVKAGGHANSEWLNDNAPIGEARYRDPAKAAYAAMLKETARDE